MVIGETGCLVSRPLLRRQMTKVNVTAASSHNATDKSEGATRSYDEGVACLRPLALASERHYANSIKGSGPLLCVSCTNPRARFSCPSGRELSEHVHRDKLKKRENVSALHE